MTEILEKILNEWKEGNNVFITIKKNNLTIEDLNKKLKEWKWSFLLVEEISYYTKKYYNMIINIKRILDTIEKKRCTYKNNSKLYV